MSLRRTPRTIDEVVAYIDERLRQLDSDNAVSPTDTRYLYTAKGDILVAQGPSDPVRLPVQGVPAAPGSMVLRLNPGDPRGVEWHFAPNI